MLMKTCNDFVFTHKQIFKTLTRDNLGGGPFKMGGPVHLHIPKATIVGGKISSDTIIEQLSLNTLLKTII